MTNTSKAETSLRQLGTTEIDAVAGGVSLSDGVRMVMEAVRILTAKGPQL